jgi:sterol desaturase/sphingolipid hydroxylase (fatty acid hydroxylase superfamily)
MGDLSVAAVPFYFATMSAEAWHHHRRQQRTGETTPGDYTPADTVASLTMGTASLVAPFVLPKLVQRLDLTRSRRRRLVLGAAGAAVATTVVADVAARIAEARAQGLEAGQVPDSPAALAGVDATTEGGTVVDRSAEPRRWRRIAARARKVAGSGAVASVAAVGAAVCGTLAAQTTAKRLFERRPGPDLGEGPLAWAVALLGWDFLYYWNHRFMHTSRYMWAIHVVHHSSERYNLSTALRQPVADALGTFVPYGALALLGVRPHIIQQSRAINLIYQFWIHTDAIDRIGPFERWFNSASHHRVHHGSNLRYIDRNHGGILIVWDRLFGTFTPEDPAEPVVYGLTKNVESYNPVRIATHEHADMLADVAGADDWSDRLSFVLRGPGWAYQRHRELADQATGSGATSMRPELAASANAR